MEWSTFTHLINTQERLMNIEMVKVHELVEALERHPLKCFIRNVNLARGKKESEHLNLRGEHN